MQCATQQKLNIYSAAKYKKYLSPEEEGQNKKH